MDTESIIEKDHCEELPKISTGKDPEIQAKDCDTDPYAYLTRDPASSENFKIEIKNIPRFVGVQQVKKKLQQLGLKPHKVKILPYITFVTFKCAEDRDEALQKLTSTEVLWKGIPLIARIAKGRADPCAQKRKADELLDLEDANEKNHLPPTAELLSSRVLEAICPYYAKPYEEQVLLKRNIIETSLSSMYRAVVKNNFLMKHHLPSVEVSQDTENHSVNGSEAADKPRLLCPVEQLLPSPILTEYRNKCEFTIGQSPLDKELVVGFRAGKYRGGDLHQIWLPPSVPFLQPVMIEAALTTQCLLRRLAAAIDQQAESSSDDCLPPLNSFHLQTKEGYWRTLTVRCPLPNDGETVGGVMLILDMHPQNLTESQLNILKRQLLHYYQDGEGSKLNVSSLLLCCRKNSSDPLNNQTTQVIFGSPTIVDYIGDLKFTVAYNAFFQVNRPAATLLYQTIGEMCELDKETVLLDICCGTGSIGLTLSSRVDSVVGIELCHEAVENAKQNSQLNNISNCEFLAGAVEDVLPLVLNDIHRDERRKSMKVVAIVDPPRPGLHSRVITALRSCERLDTIVYVSCDISAVTHNFVELTRMESKRVKGAPFVPKKLIAVDLFPQTAHVECAILCERSKILKKSGS